MKLKQTLLSAVLAGICAVAPGMAHAVLVTEWDYVVSTGWTTWSPAGVQHETTDDLDILRWGTPVNGGGRSSLSVTRLVESEGSAPLVTNSGEARPGATITHNNFMIQSPTLQNAGLDVSLQFTPRTPAGNQGATANASFNIEFIETTNTRPCPVPQSVSVCDDVFILQNPEDLTTSFEIDGYLYTASLVFDPALFEGGTISFSDFDGDGDDELFFLTEENRIATLRTGIVINAVPLQVPEPAALGLVGAGLAGLGLAARRRRRA